MKWPEHAKSRSQDLEPYYHDCGQFYCCKTAPFMEYGTTDLPHTVPTVFSYQFISYFELFFHFYDHTFLSSHTVKQHTIFFSPADDPYRFSRPAP